MKVTYSGVVSTLALFIALGGTGYAVTALPRDSVTAREVKNSSLTHADIKDRSIVGEDILPGTLSTLQIGEGSLNGGDIADQSLDVRDIKPGSLTGALFADGSISASKLSGLPEGIAPNDPRLSDRRIPEGAAGGDLTGSFPNPTLGSGVVGLGQIVNALRDGAAATPTLRSLGSGANQAAAGDDARLSDARTPTGAAGGDLDGTYPNPTIGADAVTSAEVEPGSLRLSDLSIISSAVTVAPFSLPANSCAGFAGTSSGIEAGDVILPFPPVDGTDNALGVVWTSGTQDANNEIKFAACNNTTAAQSAGGTIPVFVLRP